MHIRIATIDDYEDIVTIYKNAIVKMNEQNIDQWDERYPNKEILMKDIENNQMYVSEKDNHIIASFVLNSDYDDEYLTGDWQYPSVPFNVVHRLCVNPLYQAQGIGTATMRKIEELVKMNLIEAIRLDAFSKNPFALKVYESLGYKKVGEVNFRKGLFYLYEKKL